MENVQLLATEAVETEKETVETVVDAEKLTSSIVLNPKRLTKVVTTRNVSEW